MPILIQCIQCKRKLRIQDQLVGKTIKCPSCQTKFQAHPLEEAPPPAPSTQPAVSEEARTPTVPPANPIAIEAPMMQTLELADPTQTPANSKTDLEAKPEAKKPAAAVTPPMPPPFPTPALKVFSILGAIMLLTALLGLGFSWWVALAVERALEARQTP